MASKTLLLQFRVPAHVLGQIDNLAGAANLDRAGYMRMWTGAIAELKRENAVRALAAIPKDMFKGLPGRPTENGSGKPFSSTETISQRE